MTTFSRLRRFLKSVPARIVGSHVETEAEHFTTLSSWAQFPEDERLALRRSAARDLIGEVYVRPDRKLIQDQPDYGERRIALQEAVRRGDRDTAKRLTKKILCDHE